MSGYPPSVMQGLAMQQAQIARMNQIQAIQQQQQQMHQHQFATAGPSQQAQPPAKKKKVSILVRCDDLPH